MIVAKLLQCGLFQVAIVLLADATGIDAVVREEARFKECISHCCSEHVGEEGRAETLCVDLCRLWNPAALD
eukprot:g15403.t1